MFLTKDRERTVRDTGISISLVLLSVCLVNAKKPVQVAPVPRPLFILYQFCFEAISYINQYPRHHPVVCATALAIVRQTVP